MRPRSSVITSAVALLLAASVMVGTPAAGGPGWPQAGYDGGSSRFNPRERRLDPPAVRQLRLEWRTSLRLDGSYVYEHIRVAAVRDGRVFASWQGESMPYRGHVVALSLERGRILWRLRWPGEPKAANARAVFAQVGSRTVALDVATGERRWRRDASRLLTATDDVRRLFLSEGDDVVAVRASDGTEIWRSPVGDLGGPAFTVDDVLALSAGDRTTTILALDATDGRPLWHRHTQAHALSYLQAGGGGRLYVTAQLEGASIVQVRSARDGTVLWRRRFPDGPYGGLIRVGAVAPRFAFVTAYRCMEPDVYECSGVVGRLFALDPRSGKTRWSIGGAHGPVRAGPVWYADAAANGSVFASGIRGRGIALAALAVETGRVRWSSSIPGRYGSITAVADGWVIAASSGAGAVPPGSKVWAFSAEGRGCPST